MYISERKTKNRILSKMSGNVRLAAMPVPKHVLIFFWGGQSISYIISCSWHSYCCTGADAISTLCCGIEEWLICGTEMRMSLTAVNFPIINSRVPARGLHSYESHHMQGAPNCGFPPGFYSSCIVSLLPDAIYNFYIIRNIA